MAALTFAEINPPLGSWLLVSHLPLSILHFSAEPEPSPNPASPPRSPISASAVRELPLCFMNEVPIRASDSLLLIG